MKKFELQAHYELNNPGAILGCWAKGHIDPQEFTIAPIVADEFGAMFGNASEAITVFDDEVKRI